MSTWIESESGNLINSNTVKEFAIIGPYKMGETEPDGSSAEARFFNLYALNVGDVEMAYGRERPFRDSHRYLIQHSSYEECFAVLDRLKETLRTGGRYFDTLKVEEWLRRTNERKARNRRAVHANGAAP